MARTRSSRTFWAVLLFALGAASSAPASPTYRAASPMGTASSWASATSNDPNAVRGPWYNSNGHAIARANGVNWALDGANYSVWAFGASTNPLVDNTAAFQSALDTAMAAGGGEVFVPPGTYEVLFGLTISSANVHLVGAGRDVTIINGPSGAAILTPAGTITGIEIAGLTLNCSGPGSKVIDTTGVTVSEGWFSVHDNRIQHCQAVAITEGVSQYISSIANNNFVDNDGCIEIKQHSDTDIDRNFFENPRVGTRPVVKVASSDVRMTRNWWVTGGTGFLGADIEVNPIDGDGLSGGLDWIFMNKFGSESDTPNRSKVRCYNAVSTYPCGPVLAEQNQFLGNPLGSTAFELVNPIARWVIKDNIFWDITTVVDDAQSTTGATLATIGESTFGGGNEFYPSTPWVLFTHGGRGFGTITYPPAAWATIGPQIFQPETPELRNRLAYSEALDNAAWVKTGVTVTPAQTDPYGTARAVQAARANAAGFENLQIAIDNTAMTDTFVVRWWGKAGTSTSMQLAIFDNTAGSPVGQNTYYQLGTGWSEYRYVAHGLTVGHSYILFVYPAGTTQTAGNIKLFAFQVADYDSAYLATSGTAAVDSASGLALQQRLLANGFITHPADAKVNSIAWIAPSLLNSWTNYDAVNYETVGYYKDSEGFVHLRGMIANGTSISAAMFVLPTGYRPLKFDVRGITANGPQLTSLRVAADGTVSALAGGSTVWTSLGGFYFAAEQ